MESKSPKLNCFTLSRSQRTRPINTSQMGRPRNGFWLSKRHFGDFLKLAKLNYSWCHRILSDRSICNKVKRPDWFGKLRSLRRLGIWFIEKRLISWMIWYLLECSRLITRWLWNRGSNTGHIAHLWRVPGKRSSLRRWRMRPSKWRHFDSFHCWTSIDLRGQCHN